MHYKDENITIKGFDLLKYRVPVDQIKNITPFYEESLIIWYSIDPIYNYKNNNVIRVPLIQHVIAFDVINGIVLLRFWQLK